MAPQVGLEPTTLRLTAGCSAIELLRSGRMTCLQQDSIEISHSGERKLLTADESRTRKFIEQFPP